MIERKIGKLETKYLQLEEIINDIKSDLKIKYGKEVAELWEKH